MSFPAIHRQPSPQARAATGVRAWVWAMECTEKLAGERLVVQQPLNTSAHANDPGGGFVG